jgi:hypothetical protein
MEATTEFRATVDALLSATACSAKSSDSSPKTMQKETSADKPREDKESSVPYNSALALSLADSSAVESISLAPKSESLTGSSANRSVTDSVVTQPTTGGIGTSVSARTIDSAATEAPVIQLPQTRTDGAEKPAVSSVRTIFPTNGTIDITALGLKTVTRNERLTSNVASEPRKAIESSTGTTRNLTDELPVEHSPAPELHAVSEQTPSVTITRLTPAVTVPETKPTQLRNDDGGSPLPSRLTDERVAVRSEEKTGNSPQDRSDGKARQETGSKPAPIPTADKNQSITDKVAASVIVQGETTTTAKPSQTWSKAELPKQLIEMVRDRVARLDGGVEPNRARFELKTEHIGTLEVQVETQNRDLRVVVSLDDPAQAAQLPDTEVKNALDQLGFQSVTLEYNFDRRERRSSRSRQRSGSLSGTHVVKEVPTHRQIPSKRYDNTTIEYLA